MSFTEKIQALRKSKSMSQEKLADAVGVSRQAVSKWEVGVSLPDMDKLIALSNLFEVSVDYMIKDNVTAADEYGSSSASEAVTDETGVRRGWYPMLTPEYEYKSKRKLFGIPLVHINLGYGMKRAKGIIAIGTVAKGFISFGFFSLGIISIGLLSAGVVGLGALTFGLLLAAGGAAVGTVAFGGIAIGIVALGGAAIGMFSFGGYASGSHIAVGGYASGTIAVGRIVKGTHTIKAYADDLSLIPAEQVRALIGKVYPSLWRPITDWITSLFA